MTRKTLRRQLFLSFASSTPANRTLDEPLAVAIDRVVPGPVCDVARRPLQHLPVALAVPRLARRGLDQQDHRQEGEREGGSHRWHHLRGDHEVKII